MAKVAAVTAAASATVFTTATTEVTAAPTATTTVATAAPKAATVMAAPTATVTAEATAKATVATVAATAAKAATATAAAAALSAALSAAMMTTARAVVAAQQCVDSSSLQKTLCVTALSCPSNYLSFTHLILPLQIIMLSCCRHNADVIALSSQWCQHYRLHCTFECNLYSSNLDALLLY